MSKHFDPVQISFSVKPASMPPSNIQVLIGRNGVGKSFLLQAMSRALVHGNEESRDDGKFSDDSEEPSGSFNSPFANVVSVTFSAFDEFPIVKNNRNALRGVQYSNVGLRKQKYINDEDGNRKLSVVTQEPEQLKKDFVQSARVCLKGEKADRWKSTLETLQADPIFEEAGVSELLNMDEDSIAKEAGRLYKRLSSGHKIVLLTITKLVELVEEKTLVLIDEPEAHLHPPLLSALVRAVSDLLMNRNGVAIAATHSPVVLQEVPQSCVWKIRRRGGCTVAERPRVETFAEHVGHLTHEVFGLEIQRSGFHKIISESIKDEDDFDDVVARFSDELGSEGRALISALIAYREAKKEL